MCEEWQLAQPGAVDIEEDVACHRWREFLKELRFGDRAEQLVEVVEVTLHLTLRLVRHLPGHERRRAMRMEGRWRIWGVVWVVVCASRVTLKRRQNLEICSGVVVAYGSTA
jgi:hypothetical protein